MGFLPHGGKNPIVIVGWKPA